MKRSVPGSINKIFSSVCDSMWGHFDLKLGKSHTGCTRVGPELVFLGGGGGGGRGGTIIFS